MEELITLLKERIEDTDLAYYADKTAKLRYALEYAISAVNNRRGYEATSNAPYPTKYKMNVLEGAVWYLGKIGGEGYSSTSENGVSISWQDIPDWLRYVPSPIYVK